MTTFPINFVNKAPMTEKLSLARRQGISMSPWTYEQTVINSGSQWRLEFQWARMSFAQAELCAGWLDSLEGQTGTFWYQPLQAYTSTLTAKTIATKAFATNSAVSVTGWTANGPTGLRVGQLIQIESQLLRITSASTIADGNGAVTIFSEPSFRRDYTAGTTVTFVNPKGLFRLSTSDGIAFTVDPDRAPEFPAIACVEAVEG